MKKRILNEKFYNEIWFRCNSSINCLYAFEYIKDNNKIPSIIRGTMKYALTRMSIIQLTTILDGTSRYSLRVNYSPNNVPSVKISRIKKLFTNIDDKEAHIIKNEIDTLLVKNKTLLKKIFHMRDTRIAHASRPSFEKHELDIKIPYFPTSRIVKFADKLQGICNRRIFK